MECAVGRSRAGPVGEVTRACCPRAPLPFPSPSLPARKGSQECSWPRRAQGAGPGGTSLEWPRRHPLHFHFPLFCPRNPLEKLHPNTFSFHFCNLEFAYDRKYSYLCYQVEGRLSGSPVLSEQGVFPNEVWPGQYSPRRQELGPVRMQKKLREVKCQMGGSQWGILLSTTSS